LFRRALNDDAAAFRDGQWKAIDAIVNPRQRLLVVQRTGSGKATPLSRDEPKENPKLKPSADSRPAILAGPAADDKDAPATMADMRALIAEIAAQHRTTEPPQAHSSPRHAAIRQQSPRGVGNGVGKYYQRQSQETEIARHFP